MNFRGSRYEIPADRISLIGLHNYFDIAMVYGVCRLMGVEDGVFTEGLKHLSSPAPPPAVCGGEGRCAVF